MKKLFAIIPLIALSLVLSQCVNKAEVERQKAINDSIKAEEERIEEENNLGIWNIQYFVDEFGDETNDGYVATRLTGRFSNSATDGSPLTIRFIIKDSTDIAFKLYEYGSSNPVKESGFNRVLVKDAEGVTYELYASNHSDRLSLSGYTYYDKTGNKEIAPSHSIMLWRIFKKGGSVKFRVIEDKYTTSTYNFTIENPKYLEKALSKIKSND